MNKYEAVIGLEVHVELSTRSKIFCSCSTEFGGMPNTQCCPVCTGTPGTLPSLNRAAVEYAVMAGLALNCEISRYSRFDRKNYFYPDLPKAYQISQLYLPICRNGHIDIDTPDGAKTIGITEIHMEEDAGKLIHDGEHTYIDYNRCGVPLLEIVSEPDFRSAGEVASYLQKLISMLRYMGISDCKLQEGSIRADVNLSIRPKGCDRLGVRTEMKNLNSFKAISRAIQCEFDRQVSILESGKSIVQQTRRWSDSENRSYSLRSKENANDYRYFPEPDLPPLIISDQWASSIRSALPEFAHEKKARFESQYGLSPYEAQLISQDRAIADFFEHSADILKNPKECANWIMSDIFRILNDKALSPDKMKLSAENFSKLIELTNNGIISRNTAKNILESIIENNFDCFSYIKEHNLSLIRDSSVIADAVDYVISENPKAVNDYKIGKIKVIAFLIGQCMKRLKGQADPDAIKEALIIRLK